MRLAPKFKLKILIQVNRFSNNKPSQLNLLQQCVRQLMKQSCLCVMFIKAKKCGIGTLTDVVEKLAAEAWVELPSIKQNYDDLAKLKFTHKSVRETFSRRFSSATSVPITRIYKPSKPSSPPTQWQPHQHRRRRPAY